MFPYDNSIVGYLPDNYAGTLKHELMHLLLFNNIQPSPPWLDEGLAALYEVSTLKGGMLYGLDNWRGKLLRENWSYIDQRWRQNDIGSVFSIPDIISKYTWKATNYTDDDHIADQVLINAISRYFFLYLQEKGTLSDFVISIRNYNVLNPPP